MFKLQKEKLFLGGMKLQKIIEKIENKMPKYMQ